MGGIGQARQRTATQVLSVLLLLISASISGTRAEVVFNAGIRTIYDTNVNGVAGSDDEEADQYLSANASLVYYTALNDAKTTYFVGQVGAIDNHYDRYDILDNSTLILSGGLYQQWSPAWSGQVSIRGGRRMAEQSARDTLSVGSTVEIKNQLTERLWIKLVGDVEDADADLDYFSYTGTSVGLLLGYRPLADTFVNGGYLHTEREFSTKADFDTTTGTYFIEAVQRLNSQWYLSGSYAMKQNRSNIAATDYDNDVMAVGIHFNY